MRGIICQRLNLEQEKLLKFHLKFVLANQVVKDKKVIVPDPQKFVEIGKQTKIQKTIHKGEGGSVLKCEVKNNDCRKIRRNRKSIAISRR